MSKLARVSVAFFVTILIAVVMVMFYTYRQISNDVSLQLHHRALWNLMDIVEYGRTQPDKLLIQTMSKEHFRYMNLDQFYLDLDVSRLPLYVPLINAKDKKALLEYNDKHDLGHRFSLYIKPNLWLNVAIKPNYNYLLASVSGHIAIMLFLCLILLFSAFIIYRLARNINRVYEMADGIGITPNRSVFMSIVDGSQEVFDLLRKRVDDLINTRTQIISSISHDLKTPLTRINYRLQLLEIEQELKDKCLQDTKEMQSMINELVSLSRFEEIQKTQLDLDALVDTVVERYIEQGINVNYIAPDSQVHFYGSEEALVRILYNVIGNAVKFANTVDVRLHVNQAKIMLSVEDDGPGVPDDMALNELFRRNVQANNQDMSRTQQGSGLGLAIVYELVHQMGGNIELRNLFPKGFGVHIAFN